jgi:hypothetical protein
MPYSMAGRKLKIRIIMVVLFGGLFLEAPASLAQFQGDGDLPRYMVPTAETAVNPSFIRQKTILLDGAWRFGEGDGFNEMQEVIQVPFVPQSKASGIGRAHISAEKIQYQRDVVIPSDWQGGVLHFDGVDYVSAVYFDGELVSRHVGAFDGFAIDISKHLHKGVPVDGGRRHSITVRVKDSNNDRTRVVGKQERVPDEGVIFYKNMTGIWKSVYLENVGADYLSGLTVKGNMHGQLSLDGALANKTATAVRVKMRFENEPAVLFEKTIPVVDGKVKLEETIKDVKLWSTEKSQLYFIDLEVLQANGETVDRVRTYTGFVSYEMGPGYYLENGKPFQFRGVLNQAIYPETLYTSTDRQTLNDMKALKGDPSKQEVGFNGERRHQTTPTKRDQWLADRLGWWMAIELPSARDLTNKVDFDVAMRQLRRIVKEYAYRPSTAFIVGGNEDWGGLEDPNHETKATDATREKMQLNIYREIVSTAPAGMLLSVGDGWRAITAIKNGQPVPGVDPKRLMLNFHDYRSAQELRSAYSHISNVDQGQAPIPANQKSALHSFGYQRPPLTPMMFSECGGQAVLTNPEERSSTFAYGNPFTNTGEWGREVTELIKTVGELPVSMGGFVYTQVRDAGNDPTNPKSGGERNGLLTADGKAKVPKSLLMNAMKESMLSWKSNVVERSRFNGRAEAGPGPRDPKRPSMPQMSCDRYLQ